MKPEEVLELAQQGNPKVIAAIINRTTEPHDIFVRVARRGSCLYVLVEGDVVDQQDALVPFIQTSLQKLRLRPIKSAIVYGRQKGNVRIAWSETIKVVPAVVSPAIQPPEIPPFVSSSDPTIPLASVPETDVSSGSDAKQVTVTQLPGPDPAPTQKSNVSAAMDVQGVEDAIPVLHRTTNAITQTIDRHQPLSEKDPELIASDHVSVDSQEKTLQEQQTSLESAFEHPSAIKPTSPADVSSDLDLFALSEENEGEFCELDLSKIGLSDDIEAVVNQLSDEFLDNSVQIADMIPSDLERCETRLLNVPSSDTDDLEQEDLQVGNSQKAVGLLDNENDSLDNNTHKQAVEANSDGSESENSAERAPTPASLDGYGPDSITTKFNQLVSTAPSSAFKEKESSFGITQPPNASTEGPFLSKAAATPEENSASDMESAPAESLATEPLSAEPSAIPLSLESALPNAVTEASDVSGSDPKKEDVSNLMVDEGDDTTAEAEAGAMETEEVRAIKVQDDAQDAEEDELQLDELADVPSEESAEETNEAEKGLPGDVGSEDPKSLGPEDLAENKPEPASAIAEATEDSADIASESSQPTEEEYSEELASGVPRTVGDEGSQAAPVPMAAYQVSEAPDEVSEGDRASQGIENQVNGRKPEGNSSAIPDLDQVDVDAFIKYPEALILILFTIAFFIWQTYIAILDNAAPEGTLTATKLAQRLGVSRSTISRRKQREDFIQWSQSKDPDGLAWIYQDGLFFPQMTEETSEGSSI